MSRSQIAFQLPIPLLDFYFGYKFHHEWISFTVAFILVATSLTHIISVTPYIADFISAYTSIEDFISFPTSMPIIDYISEATSILPTHHIKL